MSVTKYRTVWTPGPFDNMTKYIPYWGFGTLPIFWEKYGPPDAFLYTALTTAGLLIFSIVWMCRSFAVRTVRVPIHEPPPVSVMPSITPPAPPPVDLPPPPSPEPDLARAEIKAELGRLLEERRELREQAVREGPEENLLNAKLEEIDNRFGPQINDLYEKL